MPPPPGAPMGGMPGMPGPGMPMGGMPMGGPEYATWVERFAAVLIDGVSILPIYIVIFIFALIPKIGVLFALLGYLAVIGLFFYYQFLTGSTGASPGKRVMGIQVVSASTGQFIGGGMGIARYFAHIVDSVVCYIGWFLPFFDAKKQTIGDKIVGTVVIKGPKMEFVDAFKSALPAKK
jgi:uncharacterized RDD family membrane protein YckC